MERNVKDQLKKSSKLGCMIPKSVETALMNALNIKIETQTASMQKFINELNSDYVPPNSGEQRVNVLKLMLAILVACIVLAFFIAFFLETGVLKPNLAIEENELQFGDVRVPNVVNKEVSETEWILKFAGLERVRDKAIYSDEIPENMICYQAVKDNTTLKRHIPLLVWVSKGAEQGVFPFVKGLSLVEAQNLLETAGFLNYQIEESQEAGMYGSVLSVNQVQGEQVALSTSVVLIVCVNEDGLKESETEMVVPEVISLSVDDAKYLLEEHKFHVTVVEQFSDELESTVILQSPEARNELRKISYITLVVSKKPERIYMKYVKDISEDEARIIIRGLGLEVGTVGRSYSDSVPEGNVISQSIEANAEVHKGGVVSLIVSAGKSPEQEMSRQDEENITAEQDRRWAEAVVE